MIHYDDIEIPADIQEFGERHGIPNFADATYRNGFIEGRRSVRTDRPYAYEFALSNGDGTYSIHIDRRLPKITYPSYPVTPLYKHSDSSTK